MERMREDEIYETGLTQPISVLARSLLPGPHAADGAVASRL